VLKFPFKIQQIYLGHRFAGKGCTKSAEEPEMEVLSDASPKLRVFERASQKERVSPYYRISLFSFQPKNS
jgi:hypothetical protein